ncbi:hypothetical protein [Streptomyces wedmorensis]
MDSSGLAAFDSLAQAVFMALDTNKNGEVQSDELVGFAQKVEPTFSEAEVLSYFHELPKSGRGGVGPQGAVNGARQFLTYPGMNFTPGGVFVYLGFK